LGTQYAHDIQTITKLFISQNKSTVSFYSDSLKNKRQIQKTELFMSLENNSTVTGTQINYYFICHTKLWLFSHHIQMEQEHDNVKLGKTIHDTSYKREHKEVIIDNAIAIDFIKKGDTLELHDIKKSRKMEQAHRWQLLYYMYYLYNRGVKAKGVLDYPLLRKKTMIEPTKEDFKEITKIIDNIQRICLGTMPQPREKTLCKKCSYQEFCFGDST